ncbi:hypothetical protein HYDPIDRAFT_191003 [Hydnomerulius pinastri MD-312]|uniref:Uncharacterized protein n=1 Tax=Hydnomerulius pinastri MD-312 TaxID=994086 RepID=A0A0C9VJT3_9AGAM|nr:hypothetical protein HYDPIDRAFT_191003 [Hydnomerulius pinastri MD-312]
MTKRKRGRRGAKKAKNRAEEDDDRGMLERADMNNERFTHTLGNTIEETYVPLLNDVTFEDEAVPPPAQIPWYPEGLAWQFNVSKKVLRKSEEFKKFHSFLVHETEVVCFF